MYQKTADLPEGTVQPSDLLYYTNHLNLIIQSIKSYSTVTMRSIFLVSIPSVGRVIYLQEYTYRNTVCPGGKTVEFKTRVI